MHARNVYAFLAGAVSSCVVCGMYFMCIIRSPLSVWPSGLALPSAAVCHWAFVRYSPSPYELSWTDHIRARQERVCAESNRQTEEIAVWMMSPDTAAGALPEAVFSHFTFRNNCTGEELVDYIEPLAGLTRSPYFCLKGDEYVVQKDYLVVSRNISRRTPHGGGGRTVHSQGVLL